jgi:predicted GIY-YIG superfamily endonuclease
MGESTLALGLQPSPVGMGSWALAEIENRKANKPIHIEIFKSYLSSHNFYKTNGYWKEGIMAKLGTVTFKGSSGDSYEFNAYQWGTNFKEDYGAVYFVTKRTKKTDGGYSHTSIYVGQTEDLSTRFDNHHKQECFDSHQKNCVCIYNEQDEDTRLEIEQDLIENYDPPCNG